MYGAKVSVAAGILILASALVVRVSVPHNRPIIRLLLIKYADILVLAKRLLASIKKVRRFALNPDELVLKPALLAHHQASGKKPL
jgi:multisubunit Na+/H+ antiporter MnhE subunit